MEVAEGPETAGESEKSVVIQQGVHAERAANADFLSIALHKTEASDDLLGTMAAVMSSDRSTV